MRFGQATLLFLTLLSPAYGLPDCQSLVVASKFCESDLQNFRPTQQNVGYRSVNDKAKKLKSMGGDEYDQYLKEHPVPVVIGPQGGLFALDHHHLARAVYEIGKHRMVAQIVSNWSNLQSPEFWNKMKASNRVYLYDSVGQPIAPSALPLYIWNLADDPYRSLSGEIQDRGGFRKGATDYFIEFKWALFFRKHLPGADLKSDSGFKAAVKQGLKIAHSSLASGMPGYIPDHR